MLLDLTGGQIIILLVPQITLFISFVIYARVEISVMKTRLATIEKAVQEDKKERIKENDEIKVAFRDLHTKLDNQQTLFTKQLFEIHGNVSSFSTYMNLTNNGKKES